VININKEKTEINICCNYLNIVDCDDTEEHAHLFCDALSGIDKQGILNNEHVCLVCVSNEFSKCKFYPKVG